MKLDILSYGMASHCFCVRALPPTHLQDYFTILPHLCATVWKQSLLIYIQVIFMESLHFI